MKMNDPMNFIYKTRKEAQEAADRENMGRDYSFVYVISNGDGGYILKVKE